MLIGLLLLDLGEMCEYVGPIMLGFSMMSAFFFNRAFSSISLCCSSSSDSVLVSSKTAIILFKDFIFYFERIYINFLYFFLLIFRIKNESHLSMWPPWNAVLPTQFFQYCSTYTQIFSYLTNGKMKILL